MSELDEKKLEIELFKSLFFIALTMLFAILGWVVSNADHVQTFQLVLAFFGILFAAVFSVGLYRNIRRLIREVRKL